MSGGGGWGLKQGLLSLDPQMSHPAAASLSSVATSSTDKEGNGASSQRSHKILGEERHDEEIDDEAMLSFIRSFKSETFVGRDGEDAAAEVANGHGGVDGVAMPGAYVQFFVAPLTQEQKAKTNAETGAERSAWSIALGAQAGYDGSPPILDEASANSSVDSGVTGDANGGEAQVALIHNHFGAVSNHGIFLSAVARASNSSSSSSNNSGAPSTRTKLDAPNAYVWGSMHPR